MLDKNVWMGDWIERFTTPMTNDETAQRYTSLTELAMSYVRME